MLYKHQRTTDLTCEATQPNRKGPFKGETNTGIIFAMNPDIFLSEWEPLNPAEMEYAYIHRTDGMNLNKGEWIKLKTNGQNNRNRS